MDEANCPKCEKLYTFDDCRSVKAQPFECECGQWLKLQYEEYEVEGAESVECWLVDIDEPSHNTGQVS